MAAVTAWGEQYGQRELMRGECLQQGLAQSQRPLIPIISALLPLGARHCRLLCHLALCTPLFLWPLLPESWKLK